MTDLSADQTELKARITKSSLIWGAVAGVLVFLLAFWLLGGMGDAIRWGGAVVLGAGAGFLARQGLFNSGAKAARCEKCGAAFSVRESDRAELLTGSEPRETSEPAPADHGGSAAGTLVTRWIEETYAVTATDTCGGCQNRTQRTWTTTRARDKAETLVPPPPPPAGSGGAATAATRGRSLASGPDGGAPGAGTGEVPADKALTRGRPVEHSRGRQKDRE